MIKYEKFVLENGLKVIVHKDTSTPLVAVNLLYNIGSKDENPEKTGFAHLFEHLMFGGSVNIPDYDGVLQIAGGENNAFTNPDFTNYYILLPKENLETAFWLESDRMLQLAFTDKSLEVQRNVVVEEYKQRYLNQPYGDIMLLLNPLAYKIHPYQWSTIGKNIEHIQNANIEEVKDFFYKYYAPNNAILVVGGNIETDEVKRLCNKWFSPIEKRNISIRNLNKEPEQKELRTLTVKRNVPYDAIYKAYHMCSRFDSEYYTCDLISDILSSGKSSRLYQSLVKEKKLFSEINAYISGSIDEGLFIFSGKLISGVNIYDAEKEIDLEIEKIKNEQVGEYELNKAKNNIESSHVFSEISILNVTMNLAYYELIGNIEEINTEINKYSIISSQQIQNIANKIFKPENCSTLYYLAENKQ